MKINSHKLIVSIVSSIIALAITVTVSFIALYGLVKLFDLIRGNILQ